MTTVGHRPTIGHRKTLVAGHADRTPRTIQEPARTTPVLTSVDVVVCGGGTAGVAAALVAARLGLSVAMVEQSAIPGGMVTHCIRWLTDFDNKGGFAREFRRHLEEGEGIAWPRYNPFKVIPLFDGLLREAQVRHIYLSAVVAPIMEGNCLRGVIIESKGGRQAILAGMVIDATGDGDVAARAGADYAIGRDGDHACQAVSLGHLLANYNGPACLDKSEFRQAVRAAAETQAQAYKLPYDNWLIAPVLGAEHMFYHLIPHVCGYDFLSAAGVSDALVELRRQAVDFYQTIGHNREVFGGIEFGPFSAIPGIRETRRIHCDAVVTAADAASGRRFEDGLFLVSYHVDIHKPTADEPSIRYQPIQPYHIPLRALLPKGLENIIVAGRCICGEHEALASYRVIANCFAMGEAAAIVARLALDGRCSPRQVPFRDVVAEMRARGYQQ